MEWSRGFAAAVFLATLVQPLHPMPINSAVPPAGLYEIIARLELPHLERWAVDHTTTICLPITRRNSELPIPIVSANSPFTQCAAENVVGDDKTLQYDIVCPGRGAAKGHAAYSVSPDAFSGRVAMVMGAKNMTMTEVQRARRISGCDQADY